MSEDWRKLFEAKQTDWLEVCKEVDYLRQENAALKREVQNFKEGIEENHKKYQKNIAALEAQLATAREALEKIEKEAYGEKQWAYVVDCCVRANLPHSSRIEEKP